VTAAPRSSFPAAIRWMLAPPPWLVICTLVFGLTSAVWQLGLFQFFELQAYDYFLRSQPRSGREADKVVIVGITEDDIQLLKKYPVPATPLNECLEALILQRPAALVLDLYRDLSVTGTTQEEEERFARCFKEHPNVLAIRRLGLDDTTGVSAPPFLQDNLDQAGFNDSSVDYKVDGTARRVTLSMEQGGQQHFFVSMLAAMLFLQTRDIHLVQDPTNPARFQLGRATLLPFEPNDGPYVNADARGLQALLDFRGPAHFPTYTFNEARSGKIPAEALRGKVVLIGLMASSVKDYIATPLFNRYPGVLLHAHVINQLLRYAIDGESPIHFWREGQETLWLLAWCAAGTLVGLTVRTPWLFVALVLGGVAALLAIYWLSLLTGLWLLLVAPATAYTTAAAIGTSHQAQREKRQRDMLMQLFSRHVSSSIAVEVWRQREQFMEGHRPKPQVLTGTVFFSDLKGFTGKAETLSPEELLTWLNEYMEMMAALIEEHDGMVIRYMGDAIMAAFGAPIPRTSKAEIQQDASNAVRCALRMGRQLDELNRSWKTRGLPTTTMRIGIATGPVVSGSIGGSRRLEYTVTGDTVVTAKRLESAHKESADLEMASASCRILVSEATARLLGPRFKVREVGPMLLEGKHEAVVAYVAIGENESPNP
jgi:adenylate cyclase